MGTNFYAHRIPNEHERAEIHKKIDEYLNGDCMLDDVLNELSPSEKGLHLGKMSCGWQFLWCLNPDYYDDNLKSIKTFLSLPDIIIYNEYGEKFTVDEFFDHIGPCLYLDDEHINAFCYERSNPTAFSRRDKEWTSEDGLRFTTGEFC